MTLRDDSMTRWGERLGTGAARLGKDFPGEGPERHAGHTVYGGAHLFSAGTATRLGELAMSSLERWAANPEDLRAIVALPEHLAARVHRLGGGQVRRGP